MSLPGRSGQSGGPAFPPAGLCEKCGHAQEVKAARGNTYVLCGLSAADPQFPKYPRLPVLACGGFTPDPDAAGRET